MKKTYLLVIISAAILAFAIGLRFFNKKPHERQENQPVNSVKSGAQISNFELQTNNEGTVTVSVMPENFSDSEWSFNIALNTHSEELTVDIKENSSLLDDKGIEYAPIDWQGDLAGGHHRSGILRFKPILPKPISLTLKVQQVGGVKERNFTWLIK